MHTIEDDRDRRKLEITADTMHRALTRKDPPTSLHEYRKQRDVCNRSRTALRVYPVRFLLLFTLTRRAPESMPSAITLPWSNRG